jgi:hypothetical protein
MDNSNMDGLDLTRNNLLSELHDRKEQVLQRIKEIDTEINTIIQSTVQEVQAIDLLDDSAN